MDMFSLPILAFRTNSRNPMKSVRFCELDVRGHDAVVYRSIKQIQAIVLENIIYHG